MADKFFMGAPEGADEFFDAAKDNRLLIQRCADCNAYQFYPRQVCVHCGSSNVSWAEASGRGTGLLVDRFPDANVVAVDASEAMAEQARARLDGRAEVLRRNLTEPLGIEPVDVVFSNAVFHWIDDHAKLFANLASVLRPGGQ